MEFHIMYIVNGVFHSTVKWFANEKAAERWVIALGASWYEIG
jgi:hypothetical protein